jgi:hypothetical protein
VVEASRRHDRWSWSKTHWIATSQIRMTDVAGTAPSESELEEASARRLLAAVDELSERASHLKRKRGQLRTALPAEVRADDGGRHSRVGQ